MKIRDEEIGKTIFIRQDITVNFLEDRLRDMDWIQVCLLSIVSTFLGIIILQWSDYVMKCGFVVVES